MAANMHIILSNVVFVVPLGHGTGSTCWHFNTADFVCRLAVLDRHCPRDTALPMQIHASVNHQYWRTHTLNTIQCCRGNTVIPHCSLSTVTVMVLYSSLPVFFNSLSFSLQSLFSLYLPPAPLSVYSVSPPTTPTFILFPVWCINCSLTFRVSLIFYFFLSRDDPPYNPAVVSFAPSETKRISSSVSTSLPPLSLSFLFIFSSL